MADSESTWTFSQHFDKTFQTARNALASRLEAALSSTAPPSADEIQTLTSELARLAKSLVEATGALPGYDQRRAESQVQELEKMLERLRVSSTPKSKFAFKRKEKAVTDNTSVATSPPPATPPSLNTQEGTTGNLALSSQSHRYLTFESLPSIQHSSPSSTLTISELDACVVNLLPSPRPPSDSLNDNHPELIRLSAIHVHNLSNTVLLLPFIEGSVLLHDLARCIVVIGCHQFRMHNSDKVDVYLSIPSHPIIEHCTRIRFAGYPAAWSSQAESQTSHHLKVQDFSHIRASPSPNWSVLPQEGVVTQLAVSGKAEGKEALDALLRLLPQ